MPRKAKAFYDRRAGCWASSAVGEVRYTKAGKPYRTKVFNKELRHPSRDELAAQAWVHDELKWQAAALVPVGDLSFRQLTEFYLEDAEKELAPDTFARRVEHLDRFGSWPGPDDPQRMDLRPCRQLTAADVRKFLAEMLGRGNSESYVSEALLKSLKRSFSWAAAVEDGRFPGLPLPANPIAHVKGPQVRRRAARSVDPAAVRTLLRWMWRRALGMPKLKQRFARIATILVLCLRDTGARPKELCVAAWDEWQLQPDGWGVITLPWWKWKNGRKTGKSRVIALPPHCARRIEWIRSQEGRHAGHIFTHRRGRGKAVEGEGSPWAGDPWVWVDAAKKQTGDTKSLQKWFNRIRKEAIAGDVPIDPKFRLYFHRSAYSTEGQRRGVPRALLAEAMGTSEAMLDVSYTDFDTADVLGVAKAVAARPVPIKPAAPGSSAG